jgi:micrococcal nuclease
MSRRSLHAVTALVLAAASLAAVTLWRRSDTDRGPVALPSDARSARVERVVDGDTVVLSGAGRSRLIGVDTPEVYGRAECFGAEASAYAKAALAGKTVRYTVGREPRDRYGRRLVYLWLEDGRSFSASLVSAGYATPLTIRPNSAYAPAFRRLARGAREHRRGLWASCGRSGADR